MPNLYPIIDGKLYQSGLIGEIVGILKISPTIIVDCTSDISILNQEASVFIKIPFKDTPIPLGDDGNTLTTRLHLVAKFAAQAIRNNEKILVHCNEGENRSSLLDALILLELRQMGIVDFTSAVSYIRERRPGALQNKSFVEYIDAQTKLLPN